MLPKGSSLFHGDVRGLAPGAGLSNFIESSLVIFPLPNTHPSFPSLSEREGRRSPE